ncbi:hypothetical protein U5801_28795, partial [Lamprobacter modestohalophilus]|uniref:hypothetical protein n=1 Tax=Lamprobacter modestohalophilus TaxID=1064514 RepID=UPI002ADEDD05
PAAVKQADLAVLAAEREQVLGPSYGPWFKDFPEPAPITIRPRDWLEVKASFGQALQTEITTRRAATDPRRPDAAAESLDDLRLQDARA